MVFQKISAWLTASEEYEAGLDLLRQTGFSGIVLATLEKGDNTYTRTRLESELRKFLESNQAVSPIGSAAPLVSNRNPEPLAVSQRVEIAQPARFPLADSAGIAALKKRRGDLQNERAELKAKFRALLGLEDLVNQMDELALADRRDWAFRIKAITRELDEIFSQLDFAFEYGYLPPVADDPAVVVDDQAELLNVRTYVSRYKKNVREAKTDAQRKTAQAMLDTYLAEKERLEKKLRNHAV